MLSVIFMLRNLFFGGRHKNVSLLLFKFVYLSLWSKLRLRTWLLFLFFFDVEHGYLGKRKRYRFDIIQYEFNLPTLFSLIKKTLLTISLTKKTLPTIKSE